MSLFIGQVVSVEDLGSNKQKTDGERIKVRLLPSDKYKSIDNIPYAFPLLPKLIHVKPKINESVLVFVIDDNNQNSQRFYLGPIISQPQNLKMENHFDSGRLLNGAFLQPNEAPSINSETQGCFCEDDDVSLYGRGNTDIILGDKDLRIRCSSRQFSLNDRDFSFNRKNPSYIKLKEHDDLINKIGQNDSNTSATIVADEINLISNNGSPHFNVVNNKEQIDDEEMKKIVKDAHLLPYGDVLVDFLQKFLQMFKSHTHKYSNSPPCPDTSSLQMDIAYGTGTGKLNNELYNYSRGKKEYERYEDVYKVFSGLSNKLLSKHVRIN